MEKIGTIIKKTSNCLKAAKGFTQISNYFLMRKDMTIYEKMVVIIIKKYTMNKTYCWPAIKTIAKEVGCSETTVKKTIKSLENKGLIIKSKDKRHRSNTYHIQI
jgi:DNA-binding MarR family transcriptional regulator